MEKDFKNVLLLLVIKLFQYNVTDAPLKQEKKKHPRVPLNKPTILALIM